MTESLVDLIAEVAAEHVRSVHFAARCICGDPWGPNGCTSKPARLATALSDENVAAGLRAAFSAYRDAEPSHAAALTHAITERT